MAAARGVDYCERTTRAMGAMEPADQTSLRVMIVERHRAIGEALGRVVSELGGAEVAAEATSADDALRLAPKVGPDVALVDLELSPSCNLVSNLRRICPDTRIIVMAEKNKEKPAGLVKALASGAVGAIYRETSPEDFSRALRSSSSQSPVVADEAAGLLLGSYIDSMSEKRQKDRATIEALAAALEARDLDTGMHLRRVTTLATACMA